LRHLFHVVHETFDGQVPDGLADALAQIQQAIDLAQGVAQNTERAAGVEIIAYVDDKGQQHNLNAIGEVTASACIAASRPSGGFCSHSPIDLDRFLGFKPKHGVGEPPPIRLVNHPNPFNPQTANSFTLDRDCHTTIAVHDLTGRLVDVLASRVVAAGAEGSVDPVAWNDHTRARNVATRGAILPGTYQIIRLPCCGFYE